MGEVVLYIAASLDGFIAKADGDVSWLDSPEYGIPNEDFGYQKFYNSIGITLMGNDTFRFVQDLDMPFPYPDKTNYVFSKSKREAAEHVTLIYKNIPRFVKGLKSASSTDIWLVGGGQINTLLLNHDLIDKIIITTIPIVLGDGIPLFGSGAKQVKLTLASSKSYSNGFLQSEFNL